jgi:uncharacterized membrane protein
VPESALADYKQVWIQALEAYRQWNEAVFVDRVRNAGTRTPTEKRHIFLDLLRFADRMGRHRRTEAQQRREVAAIRTYYDRIQRFEERRRLEKST